MDYENVLCDANNLYKAYTASIKNSKWKESTQKFMLNYLDYIFRIQDALKSRMLVNGKAYEFELHERGRVRPITGYPVPDRIIRHVLCDDIFLSKIKRKIIYDNGASIKGRGISHTRRRFETHLHRYFKEYGNKGYILFGDFRKFYDNIIHDIAKRQLLDLVDGDDYVGWLLDVIFDGFKIDVSYMSEVEYSSCLETIFNKLDYRMIPKSRLTGEKFMEKSVNIGDQLSQLIGVYYPHRIDTYIKYVRSQKYYGRYMDDWYVMSPSKSLLHDILTNVCVIAKELGIHVNKKKTRIVKICGPYKYLQIKYTLTDTGKIIKRINPERLTAMRRKIKKLAIKVDSGELPYENVESMFRSWMCDFYKILSKQQRSNILLLYERLFNKQISVVGKKMYFQNRGG